MTLDHLKELFAREDTYIDEENLNPRYRITTYSDLDAFLLLDKLVPSVPISHMPGHRHDLVTCAEHDEIWLNIDLERLAAAASDDDITALQQLGVRLDNSTDSLALFV